MVKLSLELLKHGEGMLKTKLLALFSSMWKFKQISKDCEVGLVNSVRKKKKERKIIVETTGPQNCV